MRKRSFAVPVSVAGCICILLGGIAFTVSLFTNKWDVLNVTIKLKPYSALVHEHTEIPDLMKQRLKEALKGMGISTTNYKQLKNTAVQSTVNIGLRKFCDGGYKVKYPAEGFDQIHHTTERVNRNSKGECKDVDIGIKMQHYLNDAILQSPLWKMYEKMVKGLKDTMILIGVSVASSALAFLMSLVKLPYLSTKDAKIPILFNVCLCGCAVVSSAASIIVFHKTIHLKDDVLSMLEKYGGNILAMFNKMFEISETWGYSHHLACFGCGCLFLATAINIFESTFLKTTSNDGYEMSLFNNDDNMEA